ncbi:T9SS type A sorting domain-containing protein [candidate division KSB1 bacterium]|nr:T9SS type A sorting domain-containing protein [candidate division KSB1 bacterium]
MKKFLKVVLFIFCFFMACSFISANAQPYWENDLWKNAGLLPGVPTMADEIIHVDDLLPGNSDHDAKVQEALRLARINSTNDRVTIIHFAAHTYYLNQTIEIKQPYNGIILQGEGPSTVLKFELDQCQNCIEIGYESETYLSEISSAIPYKSYTFSAGGLSPNTWIRISENRNAEGRIYEPEYYAGAIGQVTRLVSVNGNIGTMVDQAAMEYKMEYEPRVYLIEPIEHIGIEKMKIWRYDYHPCNTGAEHGNNVLMKNAVNCWIRGVHFEQTCRNHIFVDRCSHLEISGCYIHEALSFGEGGRGYGVLLNRTTTKCLIENNIFNKLRHAMIVQSGSNSNVFVYNYSYNQHWVDELTGLPFDKCVPETLGYWCGGDICLHGNYPFSNLFEHNWACIIVADGYHGMNGINNWFVRNMTYDDEQTEGSEIKLYRAGNYVVLGCMMRTTQAAPVDDDECSGIDQYGTLYGTSYDEHLWVYKLGTEDHYWHPCVSVFYDAKPPFSGLSWPSIGPKTSQGADFYDIHQQIPARVRFNSGPLTYIEEGDLTEWPTIPQFLELQNKTITTDQVAREYITAGPAVDIASGANVSFAAGDYIRLLPGFIASSAGATQFCAYIDPALLTASAPAKKIDEEKFKNNDLFTTTSFEESLGNNPTDSLALSKAVVEQLPTEFAISANYPNPFNLETRINYELPEESSVSLNIYNVYGQLVLSLVDKRESAGYKTAVWNGCDRQGKAVSSGVYFYVFNAGDYEKACKMILTK